MEISSYNNWTWVFNISVLQMLYLEELRHLAWQCVRKRTFPVDGYELSMDGHCFNPSLSMLKPCQKKYRCCISLSTMFLGTRTPHLWNYDRKNLKLFLNCRGLLLGY